MTIESFVAGLSHSEKLLAMELIWRDLRAEGDALESPSWHDEEVNRRLANPLAGEALGIKAALEEIRGWRNDRKTSS
ncbi:MAG: hypothetical protein RLY70_656 [Planctomycetota bacterium]|jgi:hypothetical protein